MDSKQLVIDYNLPEKYDTDCKINESFLAIRAIILSNLFTVKNNKVPRENCKKKVLGSFKNEAVITYTGEELRADDEDFFMYCLKQARDQNIGLNDSFKLRLTHTQLINDVIKDKSKRGYDRLDDICTRLVATSLNFNFKSDNFDKVSLFSSVKQRDNDNKRSKFIEITFHKEIFYLFGLSQGYLINQQTRDQLKPLTKKIQSLIIFNDAEICTFTISQLYAISGSNANSKSFKALVNRSKKELIDNKIVSDIQITRSGDIICFKPKLD